MGICKGYRMYIRSEKLLMSRVMLASYITLTSPSFSSQNYVFMLETSVELSEQ